MTYRNLVYWAALAVALTGVSLIHRLLPSQEWRENSTFFLAGLVFVMPFSFSRTVSGGTAWASKAFVTLMMPVLISAVIVGAALYVILFRQDDGLHKWAYGVIGTVVGFWLKGMPHQLP